MEKKATRLHFTEDELANEAVRKAADRADQAAGKAEEAVKKASSRPKKKLRMETDASAARKGKFRFEKAEIEPVLDTPSRGKHSITRASYTAASARAHQAMSEHEDDNVGVEAVHRSEEAAEATAHTINHAMYSRKMSAYNKAEKLIQKSDRANEDALYEKYKADHPDASTNPISRWRQRQAIKKEYAAAKAGNTAAGSAAASRKSGAAAKESKKITERVSEFVTEHSKLFLVVGVFVLLFMVVTSMFSSCTAMFQGGTQMILGTSYTAADADITGADGDYSALEAALRSRINNIERTHSGYDEYRYELDEINHNPYELASYLTVLFEDYTRAEVQSTLQRLFELQYELTLTEEVEIRTRTETRIETETDTRWVWDEELGEYVEEEYEYEVEVEYEVEYEYFILNVKLVNYGMNYAIANSGLTAEEMERYRTLLETQGNRPDLFEGNIYASPGEYTDYDIPGEALTDERFANMIREAEKYLGYPYVWGGSNPSTSFDCSGFVSWVINNCGNGWSVGRLTASGLMNICDIIPRSSAKPGDLIFFQGTYDTSGASHVGIYVGNGMMIHCGNPISYASIETSYWQSHFYCFGRLP